MPSKHLCKYSTITAGCRDSPYPPGFQGFLNASEYFGVKFTGFCRLEYGQRARLQWHSWTGERQREERSSLTFCLPSVGSRLLFREGLLCQPSGTRVTESQVSRKVKKLLKRSGRSWIAFFPTAFLHLVYGEANAQEKREQAVTVALWTREVGETFLRRAASHSSSCGPQPQRVFCLAGRGEAVWLPCSSLAPGGILQLQGSKLLVCSLHINP